MSIVHVSSNQVAAPILTGVSINSSALVPRADRGIYAQLPNAAKDDLRAKFRVLAPLILEGKKPKDLTRRLADAAKKLHISSPTCRRLWDAYWINTDWKALINRSLAGPGWQQRKEGAHLGITHRPAFIEFVRGLFESNQRKSRPAYKYMLLPRLAKWRRTMDPKWAIPGYDTPPPNAEGFDHPAGWSYDNLMEHASSRFELLASRIGRDAAYCERPLVCSTRVGLWVASHYSFDDKWHDFFVNSLAERQAGRPLELCSRDLYSARKLRWGVRFRVRDKDNPGKYKGLTGMMARMVLAATLYLDGYSPRGTVCVIEHGTATFPELLRAHLTELTGGLVTFSLSGMQGDTAHDGQYPGPSRGNPRHKASHESHNGYEHNVFADLPGQTGKDVAHRPEGLGALLDENAKLLAALDRLPAARADQLEFPLVSSEEFHRIAWEKYGQIEDATDHQLMDWAQCGHLVDQVWLEGQWRDLPDMDTLPPDTRARLCAALDGGAVRTRPRQMSRREVWNRGACDLIKLPGHGVWEILQEDLATERVVVGNQLAFEDVEIGSGKHRFWTRGVDAFGQPVDLRDRETYRVVVNPFAADTAFVGDRSGRFIGEFPAVTRPTRATTPDDHATQAAYGAVAHREGQLLAPLRARHQGEADAKAARERHNERLLDTSKPATREERAAVRHSRKTAFSSHDFLAPEVPAQNPPARTHEAPAVATGEGFEPRADQPATEHSAPSQTYDARDFI